MSSNAARSPVCPFRYGHVSSARWPTATSSPSAIASPGSSVAAAWARCTKRTISCSNEQVALKTLRGDLADDEALLPRFHQEISIARKVTHPNVCRIFEVGIHRTAAQPPLLFFAMELLHGQTLADRIRAGRLTAR